MTELQMNETINQRAKELLTIAEIKVLYLEKAKKDEAAAKSWLLNHALVSLLYTPKERIELSKPQRIKINITCELDIMTCEIAEEVNDQTGIRVIACKYTEDVVFHGVVKRLAYLESLVDMTIEQSDERQAIIEEINTNYEITFLG